MKKCECHYGIEGYIQCMEGGGEGGERERERESHLRLLALGLLIVPFSSVMTRLLQLESVCRW